MASVSERSGRGEAPSALDVHPSLGSRIAHALHSPPSPTSLYSVARKRGPGWGEGNLRRAKSVRIARREMLLAIAANEQGREIDQERQRAENPGAVPIG